MLRRFASSPLFKVNARYGAIAGILSIVFVITSFYMGKHPFLVNPYLDFRVFIFVLLIFFSLKELRDYFQEGILYFWQGTAGSMIFLTMASLLGGTGILVFGSLVPAFLAGYVEQFTLQFRNLSPDEVEQIGKEALESNLRQLPSTTIVDLARLYAIQTLVIGFFISVIISVILRRQPKNQ